MKLFNRLRELFGTDEDIVLNMSETALQNRSAPILRQVAINHLRRSNGVVARSFRGEYLAAGMGNYENFLREQARLGAWGTYIEATALGELLDCNVVVTPVTKGIASEKPICLHRAASADALTVHLYNSNNTHWYVNSQTLGDGNCLYNAFAQALRTLAKKELSEFTVSQQTSPTKVATEQGFFAHHASEEAVVKHQKAIAAVISHYPTTAELEVQLKTEHDRVSKLPVAQQQQIASDYQLALKLAREEMQNAYKHDAFSATRCGGFSYVNAVASKRNLLVAA